MVSFTGVLLGIMLILTIIQMVYTYLTRSAFACPDCPECPTFEDREIVISSKSFVNYIKQKFIDKLNDDTKSIDFLKFNVIFADNYVVNYEADAESIMANIRKAFENSKSNFTEENLIYVQSTNEAAKQELMTRFNIIKYPTPLIYFKDNAAILFAHLDFEWKILIDITQIQ